MQVSRTFRISDLTFEVPSRYSLTEPIGQGAYGVVVAGVDLQTGSKVAVKRIEGIFDHLTFARRTLRELRILRFLHHENVASLRDVFLIGNRNSFDSVYVISDLMETDLASILKSGQEISDRHLRFFTYQLFRGLKYLHSVGVVHRDLKLRNLLVSGNCDLKICDFGLSRVLYAEKFPIMTEYTCTRWFRAPEILLGLEYYDFRVDLWSAACILAEMLTRKPLFPGQNTQHQLQLIVRLVGTPKNWPTEGSEIFSRRNFRAIFPDSGESAVNLLEILLQFDFQDRPTAAEALRHKFFGEFRDEHDEPEGDRIPEKEFEFDERKLDIAGLRAEIYYETSKYYRGFTKRSRSIDYE